MKRILIISIVVLVTLGMILGVMQMKIRANSPEVLLKKLKADKGDKEALTMKLNLARGDTVRLLIDAFVDDTASIEFRADMLTLLFSKFHRSQDANILRVLKEALKHPNETIRMGAVTGFDLYGNDEQRYNLAACVDDPNPEIRREVMISFVSARSWRGQAGSWEEFPDEERLAMVKKCLEQVKTETDEELIFLNRSILGKEIALQYHKAFQKLKAGDFEAGEEFILQAVKWDPENHRARVRLPRYYLEAGRRDKAVELAAENQCLVRIPRMKDVPKIDGDPTEAAWKGSYQYIDQPFYSATTMFAPKVAEGKSEMYVGHRDGTIYIAVLGYEDDLHELTVKHKTRDSDVWRDDCVEIFIDAEIGVPAYYQFVINPIGALFDQYDQDSSQNFPCQLAAQVFHDRGYWACEFSVPVKDLHGRKLTADTLWGFDVTRTRIGPASEMCAFWPTFGATANCQYYPLAVFEGLEKAQSEPNEPVSAGGEAPKE